MFNSKQKIYFQLTFKHINSDFYRNISIICPFICIKLAASSSGKPWIISLASGILQDILSIQQPSRLFHMHKQHTPHIWVQLRSFLMVFLYLLWEKWTEFKYATKEMGFRQWQRWFYLLPAFQWSPDTLLTFHSDTDCQTDVHIEVFSLSLSHILVFKSKYTQYI